MDKWPCYGNAGMSLTVCEVAAHKATDGSQIKSCGDSLLLMVEQTHQQRWWKVFSLNHPLPTT